LTHNIEEIDSETYADLLKQEGDVLPLYYLTAVHFLPPRPMTDKEAMRRVDLPVDEDDMTPYGMQDEFHYLPVMLLNVHKPVIHKELSGSTVFIIPADWEEIDYQTLSVIHIDHNAWAYRLERREWDAYNTDQEDSDDPMSDAHWYFNPKPLPDYDLGKVDTH
jgi:hypothetical protein